MRRFIIAALVGGVLILAAPALATHGIGVTYTGPVKPGSELRLDCPEGYVVVSGEADFYRDRQAGATGHAQLARRPPHPD